jgi:hypothetical protein
MGLINREFEKVCVYCLIFNRSNFSVFSIDFRYLTGVKSYHDVMIIWEELM